MTQTLSTLCAWVRPPDSGYVRVRAQTWAASALGFRGLGLNFRVHRDAHLDWGSLLLRLQRRRRLRLANVDVLLRMRVQLRGLKVGLHSNRQDLSQ